MFHRVCLFLGTTPFLLAQAIVQQTNCPKNLVANTIVVAQAVSSQANYPIMVLACYKLDSSVFSVITGAPGTLPTLTVTGAVASGAAGSTNQIQINQGSSLFGAIAGVTEGYLTLSDNLLANASISLHGFLPKIPGNATYCLSGLTGLWTNSGCPGASVPGGTNSQIQINNSGAFGGVSSLSESYFNFSNVTTGNATTGAHGFLSLLSGSATDCLIGTGIFAACPGGGTGSTPGGATGTIQYNAGGGNFGGYATLSEAYFAFTNVTTGNSNTSNHGFLPKLSGNATDCFLGTGVFGSCPGGGGGGVLTVKNSGTVVGARSILNFNSSSFYTWSILDDGININVQPVPTGIVVTYPPLQSGTPLFCASASNSTSAYTCFLSPTSIAVTIGEVVNWVPDVSCTSGTITLSVDGFSGSLFQPDGATSPGSTYFVGGEMYRIWWNGTAWLKVN